MNGVRPERLWSVHDVSEFLGIPVATLYRWRCNGSGPKSVRIGKHLRYDPAEVYAWVREQQAA
ncbi:helix-turn-helix transcriptional regulator [Actinopolymorpha singaporensis]|uniref:Predicted DNA-binding transcriptional regulator AlpA n=1 Tax=Actinopolymorpha singaporensis TaxID=117157 RepID=A0A1H1TB74_9ACTN|nr:helix-turn-helix domain-containing protein [Actinopolymorpha singaporensis]SDS57517.1 Predicted DNA-binding transcriptional regulator AlpA [Actinopolymorpha singaporensis]